MIKNPKGNRAIMVDLPAALYGQLKAHSTATGVPMATIVRRLIGEFFADKDGGWRGLVRTTMDGPGGTL